MIYGPVAGIFLSGVRLLSSVSLTRLQHHIDPDHGPGASYIYLDHEISDLHHKILDFCEKI